MQAAPLIINQDYVESHNCKKAFAGYERKSAYMSTVPPKCILKGHSWGVLYLPQIRVKEREALWRRRYNQKTNLHILLCLCKMGSTFSSGKTPTPISAAPLDPNSTGPVEISGAPLKTAEEDVAASSTATPHETAEPEDAPKPRKIPMTREEARAACDLEDKLAQLCIVERFSETWCKDELEKFWTCYMGNRGWATKADKKNRFEDYLPAPVRDTIDKYGVIVKDTLESKWNPKRAEAAHQQHQQQSSESTGSAEDKEA